MADGAVVQFVQASDERAEGLVEIALAGMSSIYSGGVTVGGVQLSRE